VKERCHLKVSWSLILFGCKVLDITTHLVEIVNIKDLMGREIQ
jgi:hypothetical protein